MRVTWLFLLGGPLIWTAHLSAVYAVASIAEVQEDAHVPAARIAVVLLTLAAASGAAAILVLAAIGMRKNAGELEHFWLAVAAGGALISFVSVLWQGLPAFL